MPLKNLNYSFIIEAEDIGKRVDKFLSDVIENTSRTKIKECIEKGTLKLNNKPFNDCSYKVNIGDIIEFVKIEESRQSMLSQKAMDLDIVYEDECLIVLNKQSGLTVHPGAGNRDNTLVNGLLHYLGETVLKVGDSSRPGIVHRLDKDTSGLMLVAKTAEAHMKLSEMIAEKKVTRVYHVFVYGVPPQRIGTINTQVGRSKRDPTKRIVLRQGGKNAITHYKLINSINGQVSLIECKLVTGRTHQIRVHMDYIKCPLIGDQTYGKDKNFNLSSFDLSAKEVMRNFKRQALHSTYLEFVHPFTNELMFFNSNYPEDLMQLSMLFKGKA
jgi:23S rRNA pseudouridine1911/1915/1917 synthase